MVVSWTCSAFAFARQSLRVWIRILRVARSSRTKEGEGRVTWRNEGSTISTYNDLILQLWSAFRPAGHQCAPDVRKLRVSANTGQVGGNYITNKHCCCVRTRIKAWSLARQRSMSLMTSRSDSSVSCILVCRVTNLNEMNEAMHFDSFRSTYCKSSSKLAVLASNLRDLR